jgi:hypothetical protein
VDGWAETKAAYRLLSNDHVDAIEILTCHASKSEVRHKRIPLYYAFKTPPNWISPVSLALPD